MFRQLARLLFKVQAPRDVRGETVAKRRVRQFSSPTRTTDHVSGSERGRSEGARKHSFIPPRARQHGARPLTGRVLHGKQADIGSGAASLRGSSPHVSYTTAFSAAREAADGHYTPSPSSHTSASSESQRERFHRQQERGARDGQGGSGPYSAEAAASYLSPMPRKYGFYDGMDEHAVTPPKASPQLRRQMLRRGLEEQAASVVEFTEGGEDDIDLGGLPASEFHGQQGWTTIPQESALFNSVLTRSELESRQRLNSWGVARRLSTTNDTQTGQATETEGPVDSLIGEYAAADRARRGGAHDDLPAGEEVLDDVRRRRHNDPGSYSSQLDGELLEPTVESIGQPRSTYGLRKMYVKGLVGYQGVVSRAEEAAIAEELLHLLQSPSAAYIAEEARYCINLYETELGLPGKDTLAFPIALAPTLQRVLYRVFFLGLIPSPPNVVQVSEMIGNFSGYPVHRKPQAIGAYVGLLNLVSTTVMHLQHCDCPWYPRLHINPRTLFVVTEPCLSEYGMGYKQTHQPFHAFEYATRVSKDYRLEVLFATVETQNLRPLHDAVELTAYAQKQTDKHSLLPSSGDAVPPAAAVGSVSVYLERLREQLHSPSGKSSSPGLSTPNTTTAQPYPTEGHELRRRLLEQGLVGASAHRLDTSATPDDGRGQIAAAQTGTREQTTGSAARRRIAALKARHDFAKAIKEEHISRHSQAGAHLLRGHSPNDGRSL